MSRIPPPSREPVEIVKRSAVSARAIDLILSRQEGHCPLCGRPLVEGYHIDHRVPLALGGRHELANWQALCIPCHKTKTAEDVGRIAKAKAQAGETGQPSRHPLKGNGRKIPSRPFSKGHRPLRR